MTPASDNLKIIDRCEALEPLLEHARQEGIVGFDTESNGFYAYHERVCLIQLRIGEVTYLVDLIALPPGPGLQPLLNLIMQPRITKVCHGAEFDVLALKRELTTPLRGLFDTMHAAQLLDEPGLSLDKLVLAHFGVQLDKSLQRYDWGRRPLADRAIRYAAEDVRYLLPLYHLMRVRLEERQLLSEAARAFAQVERMTPRPRMFDPTAYRRLRGFFRLHAAEQEALRRLFLLREEIARKEDLAPFRVMNTETLIRLAQARPRTRPALEGVAGLPAWLLRRSADRILETLLGPDQPPGAACEVRLERPSSSHRGSR